MGAPDASSTKSLVTFGINAGGSDLPKSYNVLSITVHKEVNRIAYAVIVLSDGNAAKADFEISKSDSLKPGNDITISAAHGTGSDLIFKGMIVKHSIKIRKKSSVLIIECRDKAAKMTTVNYSKYNKDVKDSDIMQDLLGKYSLDATVDATSVQHKELIQYNATDWDFMLCRADANAMLCFNEDGQVKLAKPVFSGKSVLTATFGDNIIEFDAEVDNRLQPKGVKATSWDYTQQALVDGVDAADPSVKSPGNFDATELAGEVASDELQLSHSGPIAQDELQSWADSKLMRHRLAKVRGRVTIDGTSDVKLGSIFSLAGVGDRFNGDAYITGIRHTVVDGIWLTAIQFGIQPDWFANNFELRTNDAASMLPAIHGLHIGIVTKLESDPDGDDRIQVRVPVIHNDDDGVWSRIATLDAGKQRGTFFRPEIKDEVIVGFINNDPRYSVVLGMLNSSAKPAPLTASDKNNEKGYVSRSGIKMIFNDDKKNLLIQTPGGNKVFIDDDQKQIAMEDITGNKVTMNKDGITLESKKDLILKATGDVKMDGVNITIKASAQLKAQGQAGGEVSSSANMVVKGAIVQIN